MNLGEAIKQIRIKLELTQEDVCNRAQVTQGFYSSIEKGNNKPSIQTLERICAAFNIPVFLLIWIATDRRELSKKYRCLYDNLSPSPTAIFEYII